MTDNNAPTQSDTQCAKSETTEKGEKQEEHENKLLDFIPY